MLVRILIAVAVLAVCGTIATVFERRRQDSGAPVRDPYPIPRQLTRSDFLRPDAPWLVALFSSTTCDGCAAMRDKVLAMETSVVAAIEVTFQADRGIHERYEISGVPMVLVADHDGVVQRAFLGAVSATDLWAAVAAARNPSLDITHGLEILD